MGTGWKDPRALRHQQGSTDDHFGGDHRDKVKVFQVKVYDYVDDWVPMLERMYERRLKGYGAIGYTIDERDSHGSCLISPSLYS